MTPHFRSPSEEGKKQIHFHPSVLNFVWNFSLILVLLPFCVSLFYRKFSFFSPPTGRIRLDPDCVSCFFPSLSVSSSIRRQYYYFFCLHSDKKAAKKSILVKIASSSRPSSHAAIIKPRMLSVYFYEVGVYLECSVDI